MKATRWRMKLFTGNANIELANEIAAYLGLPVGEAKVNRFSDGEISVAIDESVRGVDVFVVQPTCPPVNEHLMELLIMIDAFRRASAARINAVIPYYGYGRQDRKTKARDPITAKLVSNLIVEAGAQRVVAVDLHATQIQGFYDIPVDHLPGVPTIGEYFKSKDVTGEKAVVLSPDVGGVTRARDLGAKIGAPLAIVDKRRPLPNVSEVMNVIGDVKDKSVIITDDIIDTAGTICTAAEVMMDNGAKEVYGCCTHAVFSGPAIDRLAKAPFKEIVITNTIPLEQQKMLPNIKMLSIAPLVGEAILRIHEDLSVSKLFEI
ncbi:Ribose-phosphate pyrophosphokinase [Candidatus Syntrophocurvum alkaliphilum]|uniref:Ribose-phosphate pyrophosphokinase n=1 Tax=Candidatus Syntrophocurvum alkaliphilum TaxID=2293317 RepID=A0A6I6DMX2_9FIRM|nr:ribose-phosphate pyrophosphokinase [Candidatus Syntrophocurvum alkaliphilum]QGU00541.1 Ribose-phosphate pyrophosphokinase [Candidatus Syntrophocurvum alkaliphilum]